MNENAGAPALSVRSLTKSYGETVVLRDVSFEVRPGEAIAIAGENGAGKSTLLDIISGVKHPDTGRMQAGGTPYEPRGHHAANRRGIFRVFQDSSLVPTLTVYENLLLSHERSFERLGVALDRNTMRRTAHHILAAARLRIDVDTLAADLSPAQRQALEIARATALSALLGISQTTILLDEPTTALDAIEQRAVLAHLRGLRDKGNAIVFVSHRFEEIAALCNRVCVLKDGVVVAERPIAEITPSALRLLMVGRDRIATSRPAFAASLSDAPPALEARSLSGPGVRDVSLTVAAGEILGVCGLEGSGKSDVGRALAGALPRTAGAVAVNGRTIPPTVRAMLGAGVAYLPGDRQIDGLIAPHSAEANIALPSLLDRFSNRFGIVRERLRRTHVARWLETLGLGYVDSRQACRTLSGGQQQRVLFAKTAGRAPKVFVMENPTRGVDSATKIEIANFLQKLAGGGTAIVLISDDLPELIDLADRIIVLAAGRLVASIDQAGDRKATEHELLEFMLTTTASQPAPALEIPA